MSHITQEQSISLATQHIGPTAACIFKDRLQALCNAAIQHYIDSRPIKHLDEIDVCGTCDGRGVGCPLCNPIPEPDARQQAPAQMGETEKAIRRMFCAAVSFMPYMDDGEASDSSEWPHIDYLRDTPDEIQRKRMERALKKAPAQTTDAAFGIAQPEPVELSDDFVYKVVRSKQPHLDDDCPDWKTYCAQCKYWLKASYAVAKGGDK